MIIVGVRLPRRARCRTGSHVRYGFRSRDARRKRRLMASGQFRRWSRNAASIAGTKCTVLTCPHWISSDRCPVTDRMHAVGAGFTAARPAGDRHRPPRRPHSVQDRYTAKHLTGRTRPPRWPPPATTPAHPGDLGSPRRLMITVSVPRAALNAVDGTKTTIMTRHSDQNGRQLPDHRHRTMPVTREVAESDRLDTHGCGSWRTVAARASHPSDPPASALTEPHYQCGRRGRGWHRGQLKDERFMNASRRTGEPQRGHGSPSRPYTASDRSK